MKVIRNVEKKEKFCAICPGTVFLYDDAPYMKTDVVTVGYDDDVFNAVALETGVRVVQGTRHGLLLRYSSFAL